MPLIQTGSSRKKRLSEIYGPGFPDEQSMEGDRLAEAYIEWISRAIKQQAGVMGDKRLHWARHRLMRQGRQWISSRDGRTWREIGADRKRVRAVFNLLGPALDFRIALLQEQRPGFKHTPIAGTGVRGRELALAQQSVAEYYFHTQHIWELVLDALTEAQTDGVSWLNVYIDKDAGRLIDEVELVAPDDERFESLAEQGYRVRESSGLVEVPLGPASVPLEPGTSPSQRPSGDIATRLLRAHETWADPEARTIHGADRRARWFLVRRVRDLRSAKIQLDDPKLTPDLGEDRSVDLTDTIPHGERRRGGLPSFPSTRMSLPEGGVYEYLLYLAPSRAFPKGKWIELLTSRHMRTGELPGGVIPVARVTDGSTDTELYPRPVMSDWISDQISVNSLGSKILEHSRLHSGSRLMALEGTTVKETWTDIIGSVVEYRGPKPDVLNPPRVSPDLWNMWSTMVRQLEEKTGWTNIARGQLTGEGGFQDVAGRAVLAARELFERQFGPMVRAAARGASEWSMLTVKYAQHLYETPRLIPMAGRPDLAKHLSREDLQGTPSVYVDPETLQPLPRALRNQLLTDYLDRGLITVAEFKKRAPFAEVRDLNMGDADQWDRAQLVNTVLEERWEELAEMDPEQLYDVRTGIPVFWQDSADVHMKALEEIALDDKAPWPLRKLATDRWGIYEELARSRNFPAELELQGMPRPPAPPEAVGVPVTVSQRSPGEMPPSVGGGGGDVPGSAFGTGPAPESSPTGLPNASQDSAEPLGAGGAAEAGLQ